jgi:hypothetical protein
MADRANDGTLRGASSGLANVRWHESADATLSWGSGSTPFKREFTAVSSCVRSVKPRDRISIPAMRFPKPIASSLIIGLLGLGGITATSGTCFCMKFQFWLKLN